MKVCRINLLSLSLLEQAKNNKPEITQVLIHNRKAREAGFLQLLSGEVYERQYSQTSHVFIIQQDDKWSVWRETWRPGRTKSISRKGIIQDVMFDLALFKAVQYISYLHQLVSPK